MQHLFSVHKALNQAHDPEPHKSKYPLLWLHKAQGQELLSVASQLGCLPGDWPVFRLQNFPGELFCNGHVGIGREPLKKAGQQCPCSVRADPFRAQPFSLFIQIRSRAKIEKIRASLFNNNDLIGLSSLDGEDELMEMSTEEILTVSVVNQSLFDTQGSPGLEDYFNDKSIKGGLQDVCA